MGNPVKGDAASRKSTVVERHPLDLVPLMVQHLDVQLSYTLMQHLVSMEKSPYEKSVILQTQLELLKANAVSGNTVQVLQGKYREIYGKENPDYEEWGNKLQEDWNKKQQEFTPVLNIIGNQENTDQAKKYNSLEEAMEAFEGLDQRLFDEAPNFLRLMYDSYLYDISRQWLTHYKLLCKSWSQDVPLQKQIALMWGQIGGCILAAQWELGADFLCKLDDLIDNSADGISKIEVMKQRTWLLHWMVFVVFIPRDNANRPENSPHVARVLELFVSEKYFCLVSLRYPYMMRYVAGAFILNSKIRYIVRDIVHVLNENREAYKDPVTEFLLSLYHDYDFEQAKQCLTECEQVCAIDYFFAGDKANFFEQGRLLLFESYSRMHQCLDLEKTMFLGIPDMEEWIVSLIRNGKMQARIEDRDGKKFLICATEARDVYQDVCERTRDMSFRLFMLEKNSQSLVKKGLDPTKMSAEIAKHLERA